MTLFAALICRSANAGPETRPITESFFGINGIGYMHFRDKPDAAGRAQRKMNVLKEAGFAADRADFWWGIAEPEPGKWNWASHDWLVDFSLKNKVEPFPILSYNAAGKKTSPATDQEIADYASYVSKAVSRYKGRVNAWEVWNEPNIPTFWSPTPDVAAYSKLLKAAYKAAHDADPKCVVVGGASSETDINWIEGIAANGAFDSMDALSFHPYSMSDGPEQMNLHRQIEIVRAVAAKQARPGLPLWITEMGWQADNEKPTDVEKQLRYMVQSHVIAAADGIERMFWFSLEDWRENGHLEGWGLMTPEGKVKQAPGGAKSTAVYRTMKEKLLGATFRGYYTLEKCMAYVFTRQDKTIEVVWAYRGRESSFPIGPVATITSMYGETSTDIPENFTVGENPVYIELPGDLSDGLDSAPPPRVNLLTNPSFEDLVTTMPYGWDRGIFYGGSNKGDFGVVKTDALEGTNSVSLSKTTDALWQSWPTLAMPGEEFRLTAHIKTTSATGENYAQILFLGGPGWSWKGGPQTESTTGTTEGWRTLTVRGQTPKDADVVRVNLVSKDNSGEAQFDAIELRGSKW